MGFFFWRCDHFQDLALPIWVSLDLPLQWSPWLILARDTEFQRSRKNWWKERDFGIQKRIGWILLLRQSHFLAVAISKTSPGFWSHLSMRTLWKWDLNQDLLFEPKKCSFGTSSTIMSKARVHRVDLRRMKFWPHLIPEKHLLFCRPLLDRVSWNLSSGGQTW